MNSLADRGSYMILAGSIGDGFLGRDKNARDHNYTSSHKRKEQVKFKAEYQRT